MNLWYKILDCCFLNIALAVVLNRVWIWEVWEDCLALNLFIAYFLLANLLFLAGWVSPGGSRYASSISCNDVYFWF